MASRAKATVSSAGAGAPDALAALIEHELKPIVLGTDPAFVRGTHQAMLRETEYHGSSGLTMFGIAALDTALWDCLAKHSACPAGSYGARCTNGFRHMRWSAG